MPQFRVWKSDNYADNLIVDAPNVDDALDKVARQYGYRDYSTMSAWADLGWNDDLSAYELPTDNLANYG